MTAIILQGDPVADKIKQGLAVDIAELKPVVAAVHNEADAASNWESGCPKAHASTSDPTDSGPDSNADPDRAAGSSALLQGSQARAVAGAI